MLNRWLYPQLDHSHIASCCLSVYRLSQGMLCRKHAFMKVVGSGVYSLGLFTHIPKIVDHEMRAMKTYC